MKTMTHDWKKLMGGKTPLWGGMAGMCGHGCMILQMTMMMPMMTMMFTLNANARA